VAVNFIVGRKVHGENNQPVSDKLYQTQLYLVHATMDGNTTYISQIGGGLNLFYNLIIVQYAISCQNILVT
jgi:hypothetical protein